MTTRARGIVGPARVLQVVTDDDRRGAQIFAWELELGLRGLGHEVSTVGLAPGAVGGLDVEVLGPTRLGVRTLAALRRQIVNHDVVVAHGSTTLPACAIASLGCGVPFVYRQISDSLYWAGSAARRLRVMVGLRRAARVVALWRGAADVLCRSFGVDRRRLDVIPNGVSSDRFRPASREERSRRRASLGIADGDAVVAYVGALVPEKGVRLAVDAIADLDRTTLLVAGDGPERASLEASAQDYRVRFLGNVRDPVGVYAAADVVVLPSDSESMPATLIEAGMMALPVVATDGAAVREIVWPGHTGLLVPTQDGVALRRALAQLVVDPPMREQLGRAARYRCLRRFSMDVVATRWAKALSLGVPVQVGGNGRVGW